MCASAATSFGICANCRHQRLVDTTRGSRFSLCERSRTDPAFAKYPRTPVLECGGWEPAVPADPSNAPLIRP